MMGLRIMESKAVRGRGEPLVSVTTCAVVVAPVISLTAVKADTPRSSTEACATPSSSSLAARVVWNAVRLLESIAPSVIFASAAITLSAGTVNVYSRVHVPANFLRLASIKRRVSVAVTVT